MIKMRSILEGKLRESSLPADKITKLKDILKNKLGSNIFNVMNFGTDQIVVQYSGTFPIKYKNVLIKTLNDLGIMPTNDLKFEPKNFGTDKWTNIVIKINSGNSKSVDYNFLNTNSWNEILSDDQFDELKSSWKTHETLDFQNQKIPYVEIGDGELVGIFKGVVFVIDNYERNTGAYSNSAEINVYPEKYKAFLLKAFTKLFADRDSEW